MKHGKKNSRYSAVEFTPDRGGSQRNIELPYAKSFERAMQEMAADPQIQAECSAIRREFAQFDLDGLGLS